MKNPSPSKDSTTTAPPPSSSPPQHPPPGDDDVVVPTPTEEGRAAGETLKTAAQVLEELAGSDDSGDGNGNGGSGSGALGSGGGGGPMAGAVAVGVGGSGGIVISDGGQLRSIDKRKSGAVEMVKEKETKKPRHTEVKDPPTGTPTCPICQRQFQTWKGAFGHMRSHPEREYRGFFRPPVFGSSSSPSVPATKDAPSNIADDNKKGADVGEATKEGDGEKKSEEKRAAAGSPPKRGVVFDLNNPMMEGEAGSSSGAAAAAGGNEAPDQAIVEERVQEEGRNLSGFDLNEMPKDNDDE